jgi:hypothetical protein
MSKDEYSRSTLVASSSDRLKNIIILLYLYWMQNICELGLRHNKKLREREKQDAPYFNAYSPRPISVGSPWTCVFITANEALRYLAVSVYTYLNLPSSRWTSSNIFAPAS